MKEEAVPLSSLNAPVLLSVLLMLRLDRLATLYFFYPLRCRALKRQAVRIPILMYHSVSESNGHDAHSYYDTCTAPRIFEQQMRFLHENGYSAIRLEDAVRYVESAERRAHNCVVITFDDGYLDFYTHAFPVLRRFRFTASVFLPTAYIRQTARKFKGKECLTWSQIRELHRAGVIFGSHTVTHCQLKAVKTKELEYEIRCSKDAIEDALGAPIHSFSYPYAFPEEDSTFKKRLKETLQKSGYEHGVSTILGTAGRGDDRFFMKRLPVNTRDDSKFFKAKLEGGYNWLHPIQYATKVIKSRVS